MTVLTAADAADNHGEGSRLGGEVDLLEQRLLRLLIPNKLAGLHDDLAGGDTTSVKLHKYRTEARWVEEGSRQEAMASAA